MKNFLRMDEIIKVQLDKSKVLKNIFLKNNWEKIIGEALADKSEPLYIKEGTLFILVENSIWIQQMQFLRRNIVENVNSFLEGIYVERITFKQGKKRTNSKICQEEDGSPEIDIENIILDREDIYRIKKAISHIKEDDLKVRFYNIMVKNRKKELALLMIGYKKCVNCGELFKGIYNICINCELNIKKKRRAMVLSFLKKNPSFSLEESKIYIPDLKKEEYEKQKTILKDRIFKEIRIYKREKKEKQFKENVYFLLKLETGIENEDILKRKADLFIKRFT